MPSLLTKANLLLALVFILATLASAQKNCDSIVTVVDALGFPRGGNGTYYSGINEGEKLGDVFWTGPNNDTVRLNRVTVLLEPTGTTELSQGQVELWSDNGAPFPNSLPRQRIAVLGNFTSPTERNSTTVVEPEEWINLDPETAYWIVVRATQGQVRWAYSDYAFVHWCPENVGEGYFDQRYARAPTSSDNSTGAGDNGTDTDTLFDNPSQSRGYISIYKVERCVAPPMPTPAPSPSAKPSPKPSPKPSVAPISPAPTATPFHPPDGPWPGISGGPPVPSWWRPRAVP